MYFLLTLIFMYLFKLTVPADNLDLMLPYQLKFRRLFLLKFQFMHH
jgi:hypothetical protein